MDMLINSKNRTISFLVLFLLIYLVVFLKLGSFHIRWWDESIYAVNAYEMLHNGKYFAPYFEDAPDFLNIKPPLTIWLQICFIKLLGYNELAIRLPSALAAAILLLVVFSFVEKRFGLTMAWLSTLILLTSKGFIGFHTARTGDTDSLLTLFTFIGNIYVLDYITSSKKKNIFLFFVFITLAFAIKMYAALLFIPAYLFILLRNKKLKDFLFNWQFPSGIVLFLGVSIGFILLREHYTSGYVEASFSKDAGRVFKVTENHTEGWSYYFDNLIEGRFSFWFIPLLIGIIFIFRSRKENSLLIDTVILFASFILILTISETKLFWYDMPIYPYLAIISAFGLKSTLSNFDLLQQRKVIILLAIIFIYPYWLLFRQSQGNTIPNGEKKLEAKERFIFDKYRQEDFPKDLKVYHSGWKGSLLFYKYKLSEKGIKINVVQSPEFYSSDKVLVSEDSLFDIIKSKFEFTILDQRNETRLIQIQNSLSLPQNDTMLKYFRVTTLTKGKIALQADIASIKDIVIKDDAVHYHLKKESYDIADSIGIEVNSSNKILSITFRYDYAPEYSNDTAYIHELHKFQRIIGTTGKEFKNFTKEKALTINKWEDGKTIFELIETTRAGKKQKVYSTLFDTQLVEENSKIKAQRKIKDQPITLMRELYE